MHGPTTQLQKILYFLNDVMYNTFKSASTNSKNDFKLSNLGHTKFVHVQVCVPKITPHNEGCNGDPWNVLFLLFPARGGFPLFQ